MCKWEGENKDRSVKNMNDCDHSTIMVDSIDELGASALLAQGVVKRMFIIFSKSLKQEMIPEKIAMDDRDIRLLRWTQNGPFSDEIWNTCIPYAYVDDDCIDEIIHSSNMLIVFDGFETEEKQKILKKTTSDMTVLNLVENAIRPNKRNSICTGFLQKAGYACVIDNTLILKYERQPVIVLFPSTKAKEIYLKSLGKKEKICGEKPYIFRAETEDEYMAVCNEWLLSRGFPFAAIIIEAYRSGLESGQNDIDIGRSPICDYLSMNRCMEIGLRIHLFMYVCTLAEMTTRYKSIDRNLDFDYAHLAVKIRLKSEYDAKKPIQQNLCFMDMRSIRKAYATWYAPMKKALRFYQDNIELVNRCLNDLRQNGVVIEEGFYDAALKETRAIVCLAENYCCCN